MKQKFWKSISLVLMMSLMFLLLACQTEPSGSVTGELTIDIESDGGQTAVISQEAANPAAANNGENEALSIAAETNSETNAAPEANIGNDLLIYEDGLLGDWQDWSWSTTVGLAESSTVQVGSRAISASFDEAWAGLALQSFGGSFSASEYEAVRFWIHGGSTGGHQLLLKLRDGEQNIIETAVSVTTVANSWTEVRVSMRELGLPNGTMTGFILQDASGGAQPVFYLDSVALVPAGGHGAAAAPASPAQPAANDNVALPPQGAQPIYVDGLADGWDNWSWSTVIDLTESSTVQAGSSAIGVSFEEAWAGVGLQNVASSFSTAEFTAVSFWIHGGSTGGHQLLLKLRDGSQNIIETPVLVTTVANGWTQVNVTMSELGLSNGLVSGIVLQDGLGSVQPTFYLDEVTLIGGDATSSGGAAPPADPTAGPSLTIDTTAVSHVISEDIYGINFGIGFGDSALADRLNIPVRRWGGNHTTRYNWKNDVSNRAGDWYFMNVPDGDGELSTTMVDEFVMANNGQGAKSIITMPLIGWTPTERLEDDRDCAYPREQYPNQQDFEQYWDCGNGRLPDGTPITDNDPTLTSFAIDENWVKEWIGHLTNEFGTAANGGVTYYALDNEPMLWNSTHRDIFPNGLTYSELVNRGISYATAIKEADPTAQTLGPVLWGWTAYFYSAADVQSGGEFWNNPPDRLANGNLSVVEYYLQQMAAHEQVNGARLLDYLDLHFYPQQDGVALAAAGGDATQELRLRSTRALWDPTYVDESWIAEPVQLIPRMRDWINANYPGTKIAITEYNWGGLEHINGALAQADVLGIFGREQVDLATIWAPPKDSDPGAFAFRMYLNYDGAGAGFGEQSLAANSRDVDALSVFASRRSDDNALTIMVINKSGQALESRIDLTGFGDGVAKVYQYAGSNLSGITQEADQAISGGGFTATFPADSITLFEVVGG